MGLTIIAAVVGLLVGGFVVYLWSKSASNERVNEANQQDIPEAVMSEILQRRVQYLSPRIDITQQVIDTMNAMNRGRK